ncbi:DUF6177 family protein [Nocardiopsis lambiniae]|uniref:DUF6177 family protein n=1 Tax=Nocardiopsis lambiniae TaxID=3075539 RepID=A0ABU2M9A8_9ACTN|nr:DUF6177 family protein [Nocardiopsis sp. DSM 44743]MDT0329185.1 DUF6177 family protein [Nocardiopsis sp. DSM 44743]
MTTAPTATAPTAPPLPAGRTLVALLHDRPAVHGLLNALRTTGLRPHPVSDGVLIELRDADDRLVAAVQAARHVSVLAEAERLLGPLDDEDVPAQPWWVEARASHPDAFTALTAFATALTTRYGGTVRTTPSDATAPPIATPAPHPALIAATEHTLLAADDRPLIPFSAMLADALATHGPEGCAVQIVTPPGSTVTPLLAVFLASGPLFRWVISNDGTHHDALTGEPLVWDDRHGFVTDTHALREHGPHPDHLPTEGRQAPGWRLTVELTTLHPASDDLLLGEAAELLAAHLTGGRIALFDTGEPLCLPWDPHALTRLCRDRAPAASLLPFSGMPDSVRDPDSLGFHGLLRVQRVQEGVKETVCLTVVHPQGAQPDLDAIPRAVAALASRGLIRSMSVARRPGTRPEPRWTGFPAPVGLALGPEGITELGVTDPATAPVPVRLLGPSLNPAAWYRVGDGTHPEDWNRLRLLHRHLDPERR